MTTTIKNEFMQHIATEEAWKNLSCELAWTETLLEKHGDKVDWKEISENRNIIWTIPMLQKFSKKVDWKALSVHSDEDWFTEAHFIMITHHANNILRRHFGELQSRTVVMPHVIWH